MKPFVDLTGRRFGIMTVVVIRFNCAEWMELAANVKGEL